MKKFLLVLGIVILSGSNAVAANSKRAPIDRLNIETFYPTASNAIERRDTVTNKLDRPSIEYDRPNVEQLRESTHLILTEYIPPDTGSPDRRGGTVSGGGK